MKIQTCINVGPTTPQIKGSSVDPRTQGQELGGMPEPFG